MLLAATFLPCKVKNVQKWIKCKLFDWSYCFHRETKFI